MTDDNPRGEDAESIRQHILAGMKGDNGVSYEDRSHAIRYAMEQVQRLGGGCVLVAGKGHEQGQIVGNRVLPFDDVDVVRDVCRAHPTHWEIV